MTWEPHRRLITTAEAAHTISRPESTIRRWVSERRLRVTAWSGRRPLFLEADVLAVDAATAARPPRTVGAARENQKKGPRDAPTSEGQTD